MRGWISLLRHIRISISITIHLLVYRHRMYKISVYQCLFKLQMYLKPFCRLYSCGVKILHLPKKTGPKTPLENPSRGWTIQLHVLGILPFWTFKNPWKNEGNMGSHNVYTYSIQMIADLFIYRLLIFWWRLINSKRNSTHQFAWLLLYTFPAFWENPPNWVLMVIRNLAAPKAKTEKMRWVYQYLEIMIFLEMLVIFTPFSL